MVQKTETLIIGGGAIGICCAYYLNALGKNVTLVEKGEISSGSSYGNAGLIVPSHCIPLAAPGVISQALKWMFNPESPLYIKPRFSRELLAWLWKFRGACNQRHLSRAIPVFKGLHLASLKLFNELNEIENLDFGLEKKGIIELFQSHSGLEKGIEHIRLMTEYGLDNRILETHQFPEYIGDIQTAAVGAVYAPHDAHLIPDRFVKNLAEYLENKGVQIITAAEVLGLEASGRQVKTAKTTRGDIAAQEIVLAGGSWTAKILKTLHLKLLLQPAKGYSLTYKRPAEFPDLPFFLAEAKVAVTPLQDTLRFAGTLELAGFDQSINLPRVQSILNAVKAYLPGMDPAALDLIEIWRGLRPCSPDGLPYIGRPPRYDNLIVATGHGTLGISLAPVTGKIVSQLAANENPPHDMGALSVERFNS